MLSVMALDTTKSTNQLKSQQKISLNVIYLIYAIVDFMHAQNDDMSVLPSLHMQLQKIQGATLMLTK